MKTTAVLSLILLLSLATLMFVPTTAETQSVILTPIAETQTTTSTVNATADSYVWEIYAQSNFGKELYLEVANATNAFVKIKYAYIMFDLDVIQPWATINSAQLQLYASEVTEAHRIGVHYCSNNSWTETDITWNSRPTFEENATDTITVNTQGVRYNWTVTENVKTALSLGAKLTVVMKSEDEHRNAWVRFYPREAAEYQPKLVIAWTPLSDTKPPIIGGVEYQPAEPTPDDDVRITCSAIDLFSSRTYSFETEIGPWTMLGGNWSIENGELSQNLTQENSRILSTYRYTDFVLVAKTKVISAGPPCAHIGFVFRFVDSNNFYEFLLRPTDIYFQKKVNGKFSFIGTKGSLTLPTDTWFTLKIIVSGNHFEGYFNDVLMAEATDGTFSSGQLGMSTPFTHGHFDDVEVSIFDGTGVKEVNLFYKVNEGAWNKMAMGYIGDSTYEATIPRQEDGAKVSFYIETVDNGGNEPTKSGTFTYEVRIPPSPPPPEVPWVMIGAIIVIVAIAAGMAYLLKKGYIKVKVE